MTKLKIASPFGIPVFLHWSFILLFSYGLYLIFSEKPGLDQIFWTILFSISLFFCVVLHELGHALTAKKFNITTKDIILSPIGGVARLVKLPEKPIQELMVSAAGPLVNLGIFFILLPFYFLLDSFTRNELEGFFNPDSNVFFLQSSGFQIYFFGVLILNLILALFNLIPAFPMDGGRILRAALTIKLGRFKATQIATIIGQVLAFAMIVFGVLNQNFMSAFIGIFVFQSARREKILTKMELKAVSTKIQDLPFENHHPIFIHSKWNQNPTKDLLPDFFPVYDQWMNVLGFGTLKEWKKTNELKIHLKPNKFLLPSNNLKEAIDLIMGENMEYLPIYDQGKILRVLSLHQIDKILAN